VVLCWRIGWDGAASAQPKSNTRAFSWCASSSARTATTKPVNPDPRRPASARVPQFPRRVREEGRGAGAGREFVPVQLQHFLRELRGEGSGGAVGARGKGAAS
jgi:hypothetical protein